MQFTCSREILDRQLQFISRVVTTRHTLPILSNLLVETDEGLIRISGTDLELAIATTVPAEITQQGSITIPAKLFHEFIHHNPDAEVTITVVGSVVECTSKQVSAKIPCIDADEYPSLPVIPAQEELQLDTESVVEALKQVVIACATDPGRPTLMGVSCSLRDDAVVFAATDSFRLAERTLPGIPVAKELSILIPMRTVQELIRVSGQVSLNEALTMTMSDQQVVFRIAGVEVYSRLLVGTFPKYQAIIPTTFVAETVVQTQQLVQALRLISSFSSAGVSNTILSISESGELSVRSHGNQSGNAEQVVAANTKPDHKPIAAAFNTKFLMDALQAAQFERVTLLVSGVSSPLVLRTDDPTHQQLVMPIRLDF
jgi:DNA polymerase III subunit beta